MRDEFQGPPPPGPPPTPESMLRRQPALAPDARITYAPWINSVSIGGAVVKPPKMLSFTFPERTLHVLLLWVASWRRFQDTRRKLLIRVETAIHAEYWYSRIERGDVIHVAGELRTQKWQKDGVTHWLTGIRASRITKLYRPFTPPAMPPPEELDLGPDLVD